MMAGAAPNRTRQLLDRSLIQKSSSRGLICGKGKKIYDNTIESRALSRRDQSRLYLALYSVSLSTCGLGRQCRLHSNPREIFQMTEWF